LNCTGYDAVFLREKIGAEKDKKKNEDVFISHVKGIS
jgi:hypothetical protein